MKAPNSPPRLIHDPEVGEFLQHARAQHWSTDRLAKNGEAIARAIDLDVPSPPASTGFTAGKVGVGLGITAGLVTALWLATPNPAEQARVPDVIAPDVNAPTPEVSIVEATSEAPPRPKPAKPQPQKVESTLAAQLALLDAAKQAVASGDLERALKVLANLRTTYPQSPLMLEARVIEVEALSAHGEINEALRVTEELLSEPGIGSKKAQVLRLRGDLFVHHGNCQLATESYRRALGLGLSDEDATVARVGLRKCAGR